MDSFEKSVSDAEKEPFRGWDFSYLKGRYEEGRPGWDYRRIVLQRLRKAGSLLDLGTGGGEFMSSLGPLPERTCVTEGYWPNTRVALASLGPHGVGVVQTWCDDNGTKHQRGALPFRTESFDLVIDRHESYVPAEVFRVLKRGGQFVTQQVGRGNNMELRNSFRVSTNPASRSLAQATRELVSVGFRVSEKGESTTKSRFLDVGAVAYYLKAIPWEVPGFSTARFKKELQEVNSVISQKGGFEVTTARFYAVASKDQSRPTCAPRLLGKREP